MGVYPLRVVRAHRQRAVWPGIAATEQPENGWCRRTDAVGWGETGTVGSDQLLFVGAEVQAYFQVRCRRQAVDEAGVVFPLADGGDR